MSTLKSDLRDAAVLLTDHPYPSWSEMADTVGLRARMTAQDEQAHKEARLWRELAEEPRTAGIGQPVAERD